MTKFISTIGLVAAASRLSLAAPGAKPEAARNDASTQKVWLPPRPTAAQVDHIYASVITAAPEATEYLLACEPQFASPDAEKCGELAGVTVTYGPSTMRIEIGSEPDVYDCKLGEDEAVCSVAAGPTQNPSLTIPSAESATWLAEMTVVPAPDEPELAEAELKAREEESELDEEDDLADDCFDDEDKDDYFSSCHRENKRDPKRGGTASTGSTGGGSNAGEHNQMNRVTVLAASLGSIFASAVLFA